MSKNAKGGFFKGFYMGWSSSISWIKKFGAKLWNLMMELNVFKIVWPHLYSIGDLQQMKKVSYVIYKLYWNRERDQEIWIKLKNEGKVLVIDQDIKERWEAIFISFSLECKNQHVILKE